jgi:hypothetical protein
MSREISTQVVNNTTSATLWAAIQDMFTSQTRARTINTRIALANLQKGNMSITEYFGKIQTLADETAAAGKKLDEEDVVSYVLAGLDSDYNSIVSDMSSRVEPITIAELYSQLLSYETRIDLLHGGGNQSAVNAVVRGGRRGGFGRGGDGRGAPPPPPQGCGNGGRGNGNYDNGGSNYNNNYSGNIHNSNNGGSGNRPHPQCQLCGKLGHMAHKCWERYNPDFVGVEEKSVGAVTTSSYGVDTNWQSNWYIDSGATDHITGDLHKRPSATSHYKRSHIL